MTDALKNDNEHTLLAKPPSYNYEMARSTLVYRLSELVFGSLLAAYILGFATFGATTLQQSNSSSLYGISIINHGTNFIPAINIGIFALISMTYAYLTAGIYLQYHTGILTMPTMPVERSPLDFMVAVVQALLFGASMLAPRFHFLAIGLFLLITVSRQNTEFKALAKYFVTEIRSRSHKAEPVGPENAYTENQKEKELNYKVKEILAKSTLEGWHPVKRGTIIGVAFLIIAGITAFAIPFIHGGMEFFGSPDLLILIYSIATIILSLLVLRGTAGPMRQGSRFLNDKKAFDKLDQKYIELEKSMLTLVTK
jgi:hypothetical protein